MNGSRSGSDQPADPGGPSKDKACHAPLVLEAPSTLQSIRREVRQSSLSRKPSPPNTANPQLFPLILTKHPLSKSPSSTCSTVPSNAALFLPYFHTITEFLHARPSPQPATVAL